MEVLDLQVKEQHILGQLTFQNVGIGCTHNRTYQSDLLMELVSACFQTIVPK